MNKETVLLSVNTHGTKNQNIFYLYLFNKNEKINNMLENIFLDETQTNIIFNGISLRKGDVAWAIYSDINFSDDFYDSLLIRYEIPAGIYLFLSTMKNPLLRHEISYIFRNNEEQ